MLRPRLVPIVYRFGVLTQTSPAPSSNRYYGLYLSDSKDATVFEEMVGNKDKLGKPINICTVSPLVVELKIIPSKVPKKSRKIICRQELATI